MRVINNVPYLYVGIIVIGLNIWYVYWNPLNGIWIERKDGKKLRRFYEGKFIVRVIPLCDRLYEFEIETNDNRYQFRIGGLFGYTFANFKRIFCRRYKSPVYKSICHVVINAIVRYFESLLTR